MFIHEGKLWVCMYVVDFYPFFSYIKNGLWAHIIKNIPSWHFYLYSFSLSYAPTFYTPKKHLQRTKNVLPAIFRIPLSLQLRSTFSPILRLLFLAYWNLLNPLITPLFFLYFLTLVPLHRFNPSNNSRYTRFSSLNLH